MKIDKLTLKNFKFFYGEETLNFEGKNILLYGENGSGKSSIYWALYTLFNNANSKYEKIQKYFNNLEKNNLLNRYAEEDATGSIAISLDNGENYTISKNDEDIKRYRRDTVIKEANIASDFIDYKLLAKLYDFKHSDSMDVFCLFESNIFDYLTYDSHRSYRDAWSQLKSYEKSPPTKNTYRNQMFKSFIKRFNDKLKNFLESINENVNDILSNQFNQKNINIKIIYRDLLYKDSSSHKKDRYLESPKIIIEIELTNQNIPIEENKKVTNAHSFLNEARLTAIALSIRLAILRTRISADALKVLVLDDLLISLDMSNREIVLNMLVEDEYMKDYQIIMLTHDKAFFDMAKHTFEYKGKERWKYFEMYVDINEDNGFEMPLINPSESYMERAKKHFQNRDYPACSNYLRKEVEQFINDYLGLRTLDGALHSAKIKDNYQKLESCFPLLIKALKGFEKCNDIPEEIRVEKCTIFADKIKKAIESVHEIINEDKFHDINGIKDRILNPQSHNDTSRPLYKKELEDAIELIEKFER